MHSDNLCPVRELEGLSFKIPAYQRGYRWTTKEVQTLLEDIMDFMQESKPEEFYSLQPIFVKKVEGTYHVIDGQQRLTTLFLIVKYFEGKDLFSLSYETREGSFKFLQNVQDLATYPQKLNIDFYHFKEAYKAIKDYVENEKKEFFALKRQEFLDTLHTRCKLLWHESIDTEEEVFVRLNSGKIPLMEAEKIKALFLAKRDGVCESDVKKRAEKWYKTEKKTRDNRDFIYCVLEQVEAQEIMKIAEAGGDSQDKKPALLDDIQRIAVYLKAIVPDPYKEGYLFDHFYKHYKSKSMEDAWERLEEAVNTLSGFASGKGSEAIDREIFHHLGFLIYAGVRISDLYQEWLKHGNESEFARSLFARVQAHIHALLKNKSLGELTYYENKQALQHILLLFNLAYLIADQSSNAYFQFNRFVLEQWSLEHIYAQNSKSICPTKEIAQTEEQEQKIKAWLEEVQKYLENKPLYKKIAISLKKTGEAFFKYLGSQNLLGLIDRDFIDHQTLHNLQNLTLLDKESNSAIGNLIFSHKRKKIEQRRHQDKLIPICTQKVFEKAFSTQGSNPDVFTTDDQEAYFGKIEEYLKVYLPQAQKEEENKETSA
ncbi:DUF262 domain-containing protein [Helicobacter bizzozeronii]|uniref:DUF262 domain-containing protein n=1 Tax=Helicobacter bizzozeronii TaxID=56877 RepID=UPI000CF0D970|nr:DUF262 domain-containing protein [Helicobacter bizzozeronii]